MTWPVAIARGWHPVALQRDLSPTRPLAVRLMGERLVVFRAGDQISVLRDHCPHRGAPLSHGRVKDGAIACPYHGWRFDPEGRCIEVPGALSCPNVRATALPIRLEAGLVWTSLGSPPAGFPSLPDAMNDDRMDHFWWAADASDAGLLDALENHLDPAHPHILHPWLVRAPGRRRPTTVRVRTGPWGAEAVYEENRQNTALLSAVMEGRRSRSIGRLWPPTMGEVRLEAARGAMLSITVVFSPTDRGLTRPWAHFASTKGLTPAWVKEAALKLFHWPVLQQDRRMLRLQQANRTEERYAIGPLDVLAQAIWRHANGDPCPETETELIMHL